MSGTGAWKLLSVKDSKTGNKIVEKKFYKSDFDEILNHPEYGSYCDLLLERAMTRKMSSPESVEIDLESYEEVKSVSMDFSEELIDPEA